MKKLYIVVLLFLLMSISFVYADSSDNYLIAKIDGIEYEFDLVSAGISYGGKLEAKYEAYNPRGEKMHTVIIRFDKNISKGRYQSGRDETYVYISNGLLSAQTGSKGYTLMGTHVSPMKGTESVGAYDLIITFRSSDWMHYEGAFSAELGRSSLSGTYGAQHMTIDNAKFSFTLGFEKPKTGNGNVSWGTSTNDNTRTSILGITNTHTHSDSDCLECSGTGYSPCPDCNGTGKMDDSYSFIQKAFSGGKCPRCEGTGKIYCTWCFGTGYIN